MAGLVACQLSNMEPPCYLVFDNGAIIRQLSLNMCLSHCSDSEKDVWKTGQRLKAGREGQRTRRTTPSESTLLNHQSRSTNRRLAAGGWRLAMAMAMAVVIVIPQWQIMVTNQSRCGHAASHYYVGHGICFAS